MAIVDLPRVTNGRLVLLQDIPLLEIEGFRQFVLEEVEAGGRLVSFFGQPQNDGRVRLYAVLGRSAEGTLSLVTTDVSTDYPSLTPDCPQAHWFEREIAEQWGVVPVGHPWLKPIRFHPSYRPGHDAWSRAVGEKIGPSVIDYFQVKGEEIHEVAVGPVHAGVIEPGSFRFQCHGEHVFHLEISLGYQHRGIERALVGGPTKRTIHYMETMAGDTSVGHAIAYSRAIESLSNCRVPLRAQVIRGIALELERLANHTGDLGALADDVGFLPSAAFCGRLRGDYLNATGQICGSRFGRGLIRPGGVQFDIDSAMQGQLQRKLHDALRDTNGAANLLWETSSVMARFEYVGVVSKTTARDLGLVGVAARASGLDLDARHDFPSGMYRFSQIPVSSVDSGDVFARAYVRGLEIQRSGAFVLEQLRSMAGGSIRGEVGALQPNTAVVSLVEGWRGEICHVAITDDQGRFAHYKVVDPSFHNWIGLAMSLRDQEISDFPLCNKSFNLSYCGHDL
jgi:Ni,Fe-hydrogenase III large subunit